MTEGARTTRALLRRFALGTGPLKRRSDRLQFGARLLLVALLLALAVPVGLAVGTAVYTQGRADAALQAAARHRTTAQLLEDASGPTERAGTWQPARARVTWLAPSGDPREAVVDVRAGARAGTSVPVWVDESGQLSRSPPGAGDAARTGVSLGIVAFVGFTVVTVLSYELFRLVLDQSRSRGWEDEWAAVEPVWTRKVTED